MSEGRKPEQQNGKSRLSKIKFNLDSVFNIRGKHNHYVKVSLVVEDRTLDMMEVWQEMYLLPHDRADAAVHYERILTSMDAAYIED